LDLDLDWVEEWFVGGLSEMAYFAAIGERRSSRDLDAERYDESLSGNQIVVDTVIGTTASMTVPLSKQRHSRLGNRTCCFAQVYSSFTKRVILFIYFVLVLG